MDMDHKMLIVGIFEAIGTVGAVIATCAFNIYIYFKNKKEKQIKEEDKFFDLNSQLTDILDEILYAMNKKWNYQKIDIRNGDAENILWKLKNKFTTLKKYIQSSASPSKTKVLNIMIKIEDMFNHINKLYKGANFYDEEWLFRNFVKKSDALFHSLDLYNFSEENLNLVELDEAYKIVINSLTPDN